MYIIRSCYYLFLIMLSLISYINYVIYAHNSFFQIPPPGIKCRIFFNFPIVYRHVLLCLLLFPVVYRYDCGAAGLYTKP